MSQVEPFFPLYICRNLIRLLLDRSSICLRRSTICCTRENVKLNSKVCRMNVKSGLLDSLIYGTYSIIHTCSDFKHNALWEESFLITEPVLGNRILGTQLVCPTDEGFQWYATPAHMPMSSSGGQCTEKTANE